MECVQYSVNICSLYGYLSQKFTGKIQPSLHLDSLFKSNLNVSCCRVWVEDDVYDKIYNNLGRISGCLHMGETGQIRH